MGERIQVAVRQRPSLGIDDKNAAMKELVDKIKMVKRIVINFGKK